jgi:hypothetical protein
MSNSTTLGLRAGRHPPPGRWYRRFDHRGPLLADSVAESAPGVAWLRDLVVGDLERKRFF